MQTIEYRTVNKSGWERGPWDSEPDKKQWQDADTGLPCLAVRGPGGHWCGYVGVAPGHPYHGKDYDACDVDVHGGLTFADACSPKEGEADGICHKPDAGEPDHVWWLGFDCAHLGDYSPKYAEYRRSYGGETYRTLGYVERQCRALAKQLAASRP